MVMVLVLIILTNPVESPEVKSVQCGRCGFVASPDVWDSHTVLSLGSKVQFTSVHNIARPWFGEYEHFYKFVCPGCDRLLSAEGLEVVVK